MTHWGPRTPTWWTLTRSGRRRPRQGRRLGGHHLEAQWRHKQYYGVNISIKKRLKGGGQLGFAARKASSRRLRVMIKKPNLVANHFCINHRLFFENIRIQTWFSKSSSSNVSKTPWFFFLMYTVQAVGTNQIANILFFMELWKLAHWLLQKYCVLGTARRTHFEPYRTDLNDL